MAENLKADGKGKTRKSRRDGPGMGHNLTELRKKAEPAVKEIMKKFDEMDSDMGGYRSEIKALYEKHADKIGMSKTALRKEVKRIRDRKKEAAYEQELEAEIREEIETFRAALEGTPFAEWASGELAKSAVSAEAE